MDALAFLEQTQTAEDFLEGLEQKPFDLEESITGEPQEGLYEGFIKPTAKAIPRVVGATAASLALLPGAGVRAGIDLLPRISEEPYIKPQEDPRHYGIPEGAEEPISTITGKPVPTTPDYEGLIPAPLFESGSLERAGKTLEDVASFPAKELIKTPEEMKGLENIALVMKPIEMAGEGWRQIGKLTGVPYAEPILGSIGEASALFGIPAAIKMIKTSTPYRMLTIKERGVVDHVINQIKNKPLEKVNLTKEQISALKTNPAFMDAVSKRWEAREGIADILKAQMAESELMPKALPPARERGKGEAYSPEMAEEILKGKQAKLPPGQGFELKPSGAREPYSAKLAAEMLSKKGLKQLPAGQGFELRGKAEPYSPELAAQLKQKLLPAGETKVGEGFTAKDFLKTKLRKAPEPKPVETQVEYKPLLSKGKVPFKTMESANQSLKKRGLSQTDHTVIEYKDGFAIQKFGRKIKAGIEPTPEQALKAKLKEVAPKKAEAVKEQGKTIEANLKPGKKVIVYKNPTDAQAQELRSRFKEEYPNAMRGEPKTRSSYDKDGNYIDIFEGFEVALESGKLLKSLKDKKITSEQVDKILTSFGKDIKNHPEIEQESLSQIIQTKSLLQHKNYQGKIVKQGDTVDYGMFGDRGELVHIAKDGEGIVKRKNGQLVDVGNTYRTVELKAKVEIKTTPEGKEVTEISLVKRYVKETGEKIKEGELDKVKEKYPEEWAALEKTEKYKKSLWDKLPEDFRRNRGINEYSIKELESRYLETQKLDDISIRILEDYKRSRPDLDYIKTVELSRKIAGIEKEKLSQDHVAEALKEPKVEKEKAEVFFVRKPTVKEKKGGKPRSDGFLSIPDRKGYEKVYKPYGEQGAGYYYRKVGEAVSMDKWNRMVGKEKGEVGAEKKEPEIEIETTPEGIKIYSGLDPTLLIDSIRKAKGQYIKARPYIEEFGRRAYKKTQDFKTWAGQMRTYLGDLWNTFKSKMKEVWNAVKRANIRLGERGALGRTPEQILKAKLKTAETKLAKVKTAKDILKKRRDKIKIFRDYFNLTDAELKRISGKDIRLMSDYEFKQFADKLEISAENFAKKRQKINELEILRKTKEFVNEQNIRQFHKLPTIKQMSIQQLTDYAKILSSYEKGDQFLTPKRIKGIERTLLKGSKTIREVLEKASKEFNEPIENLKEIRVDERDRFRYDTPLARRNPFYNFMVDTIKTAEIKNQVKYFNEREKLYRLGKLALKSRKRVLKRLIPRQKELMEYLEAEELVKVKLAKTLTPEEINLAEGIEDFYRRAYNWLLVNQELKTSRFADSQYVFHSKRPLSELLVDIPETGIKSAIKDLLNRWRLDEAQFKILDSKTGEILRMKKFFRQTLYRTGELTPSKNIIKSTDIYMQQFFKKMAIDESVPVIETLAMALRPKGKTKEGLLLNNSLMKFVKEYLNTKKGRTLNIGIPQGGKMDTVIRFVNQLITLRYIALNMPLQFAAIVGETTAKTVALGNRKMILANARKLTPRGRRILKKYKPYTGEGVLEDLFQPARNIGENVNMLMYGLFKWSRKVTRQDILLGNMTKAEFKAETIGSKRLAQLTKLTGRWVDIGGAESIIGKTSTGAAITKFRGWAIPIMSSAAQDAASLARTLTRLGDKKKRLTWSQFQELYRIAEIGVLAAAIMAVGGEEDRDTFAGKLRFYALREMGTIFNALSTRMILSAGVTIAFLEKFGQNLYLLLTLEKYKTKKGLKGVEALKKQFKPAAVSQFGTKKKKKSRQQRIIEQGG